jgi:hypothetical protein
MMTSEGSSREDPLWEYMVLMVTASDAAAAEERAYRYGRDRETQYVSADGKEVRWRCVAVHKVQVVEDGDLRDVCEIFNLFLRDNEAKSILEPIDD